MAVYDVETDFTEQDLEWAGRPITGGNRARRFVDVEPRVGSQLSFPVTQMSSAAATLAEPILGLALLIDAPPGAEWGFVSKEGARQTSPPPVLAIHFE